MLTSGFSPASPPFDSQPNPHPPRTRLWSTEKNLLVPRRSRLPFPRATQSPPATAVRNSNDHTATHRKRFASAYPESTSRARPVKRKPRFFLFSPGRTKSGSGAPQVKGHRDLITPDRETTPEGMPGTRHAARPRHPLLLLRDRLTGGPSITPRRGRSCA